MDANLILKSPRAKIKRAYSHIDELRKLTTPLSRDLYALTLEHGPVVPYANRSQHVLRYRPKDDIAEAVALIIGDFLNNIRSALEHLASGIVRTQKPGAEVHFPIRRARKDLIAASELAAIEKTLPGSKKLLLDQIRPDGGPNEATWAFASINNDDKHNLLVPTVAVTTIGNLNLRTGGVTLANCAIGFDATREAIVVQSASPIAIENNFQTTVDVRFGQGNPFENEPVIPTLLQVAEVVAETLGAFENLIRNSP